MKKQLLLFFLTLFVPLLLFAQEIQFCVDVSMNRDSMFFGVADNTGNPEIGQSLMAKL